MFLWQKIFNYSLTFVDMNKSSVQKIPFGVDTFYHLRTICIFLTLWLWAQPLMAEPSLQPRQFVLSILKHSHNLFKNHLLFPILSPDFPLDLCQRSLHAVPSVLDNYKTLSLLSSGNTVVGFKLPVWRRIFPTLDLVPVDILCMGRCFDVCFQTLFYILWVPVLLCPVKIAVCDCCASHSPSKHLSCIL